MTHLLCQHDRHRRILVIDDTESIHHDFRKTLAANAGVDTSNDLAMQEAALFGEPSAAPSSHVSFELDSAMQGEDGYQMVRDAVRRGEPYALAFVDMRMPPGWDGLQTIEHLWQEDPRLQVVICSAYSDHSWDQIIDRLNVQDRLLILKKPFDRAEVAQLALALTEKWRLSRQAQLKLEELEHLVEARTTELRFAAMHDRLTGLPNRPHLFEQLRHHLDHTTTHGLRSALFFIDFDRFKVINDSLGHEAGDSLLVQIARRLVDVLAQWRRRHGRGPDPLAARLGGDEFVVVLWDAADDARISDLAQTLLTSLREPYRIGEHEVCTSASIGITVSSAGYDSPEAMLRDADAAMYSAKLTGPDKAIWFDQSMHEQAVQRLNIEQMLRTAINDQQMKVYYQPIVSATDGRIVGLESLVRWHHPQDGVIPPAEFIHIAEETNLILPLGQHVLHTAIEQLCAWRRRYPHLDDLYIAVNLSKRQLLEPDFVERLDRMLRDAALPPARLTLEVTESFVMDAARLIVPVLEQIKALGVCVAMDDFGSGHSSLNCLHRFPTDVLKIDRTFIHNIEEGRPYAAVIQAIMTLAGNLGMRVIAEGIETLDQLALVQALDCDSVQGYFFAKPMPADEVETLLAANQCFTSTRCHASVAIESAA